MIDVLPTIQTAAIVAALLFSAWQLYRYVKDTKKHRFLTLGERYDEFIKQSIKVEKAYLFYMLIWRGIGQIGHRFAKVLP